MKHAGVTLSTITLGDLDATMINADANVKAVKVISSTSKNGQSIITFTASLDVTSFVITGTGDDPILNYANGMVQTPSGATVATKETTNSRTYVVRMPETTSGEYTITTYAGSISSAAIILRGFCLQNPELCKQASHHQR